jgi:uncharacterized protein YjiS (DUF1127 family)
VQPRNLYDPGLLWRVPRVAAGGTAGPSKSPRLNRPKRCFPLIFSFLSYAFSALLRRNIIAFLSPGYPYFPANSSHRSTRRIKRKRPVMFANIVRSVREWKRYNQSLSELSRLGDRELADIGISRSDIPRVAWKASHQN